MSGLGRSVEVGGSLSSPMLLSIGVPQGSVLGPLVFILYTHPPSKLISSFESVNHHLYSDDAQICITIAPESAATAIPELQPCLESVQSWMDSGELELGPDGAGFVVFGSKQLSKVLRNKLSHLFPVNILGDLLSPSEKVRNLGVIFDSSLRFSTQIVPFLALVAAISEILLGLDVTSINLLQLQLQMH